MPCHAGCVTVGRYATIYTGAVVLPRAARTASDYASVYWYGLAPSEELLRILSAKAAAAGLAFSAPTSPVAGETLYHLTPVNP